MHNQPFRFCDAFSIMCNKYQLKQTANSVQAIADGFLQLAFVYYTVRRYDLMIENRKHTHNTKRLNIEQLKSIDTPSSDELTLRKYKNHHFFLE